MFDSVYDLKNFYSSRAGRLVRRLVTGHLREIWPDLQGQRLLGYGYAVPYLKPFMGQAERTVAIMPGSRGVHQWPLHRDGLAALAAEGDLPFASESFDRILLVHGLEVSQAADHLMSEIWRVLRSNGRLLLVVPNRLGLWARADWTPFGYGTPYTAGQVTSYLRENMLVPERVDHALYMPPFKTFLVLRTAYTFEGFGQFVFPGLAGLHIIEASKQIYAGIARSRTAREAKKGRIPVGDAVPTG